MTGKRRWVTQRLLSYNSMHCRQRLPVFLSTIQSPDETWAWRPAKSGSTSPELLIIGAIGADAANIETYVSSARNETKKIQSGVSRLWCSLAPLIPHISTVAKNVTLTAPFSAVRLRGWDCYFLYFIFETNKRICDCFSCQFLHICAGKTYGMPRWFAIFDLQVWVGDNANTWFYMIIKHDWWSVEGTIGIQTNNCCIPVYATPFEQHIQNDRLDVFVLAVRQAEGKLHHVIECTTYNSIIQKPSRVALSRMIMWMTWSRFYVVQHENPPGDDVRAVSVKHKHKQLGAALQLVAWYSSRHTLALMFSFIGLDAFIKQFYVSGFHLSSITCKFGLSLWRSKHLTLSFCSLPFCHMVLQPKMEDAVETFHRPGVIGKIRYFHLIC